MKPPAGMPLLPAPTPSLTSTRVSPGGANAAVAMLGGAAGGPSPPGIREEATGTSAVGLEGGGTGIWAAGPAGGASEGPSTTVAGPVVIATYSPLTAVQGGHPAVHGGEVHVGLPALMALAQAFPWRSLTMPLYTRGAALRHVQLRRGEGTA